MKFYRYDTGEELLPDPRYVLSIKHSCVITFDLPPRFCGHNLLVCNNIIEGECQVIEISDTKLIE